MQVIDQLDDLLRRLGTRPLAPRQSFTDDGRLAVDVPGHIERLARAMAQRRRAA